MSNRRGKANRAEAPFFLGRRYSYAPFPLIARALCIIAREASRSGSKALRAGPTWIRKRVLAYVYHLGCSTPHSNSHLNSRSHNLQVLSRPLRGLCDLVRPLDLSISPWRLSIHLQKPYTTRLKMPKLISSNGPKPAATQPRERLTPRTNSSGVSSTPNRTWN